MTGFGCFCKACANSASGIFCGVGTGFCAGRTEACAAGGWGAGTGVGAGAAG